MRAVRSGGRIRSLCDIVAVCHAGDHLVLDHPELPDEIVVLPDTPVAKAWDSFLVFEALHHGMDIMNPLLPEDLDAVVTALRPVDGNRVLDIACGHGEAVLRIAANHAIEGVGVDLSPWQIIRAATRAGDRDLKGSLTWWLGRGEDTPPDPEWDIVMCIGASWIWDGFEGTVRAIAERTRPGGAIAVGDVQRLPGVDAGSVPGEFGEPSSRHEQLEVLKRHGLTKVTEIVPGSGAWNAYQNRIMESAVAYAKANPGDQADGFLAEQRRWAADHADAMDFITFTVWVATVA